MPARLPKPERGEARQALVTASLRLFAAKGYRATTTRDIAVEAGVSHALLRYHFASKAGLLAAVDEEVLTAFSDALGVAQSEGEASEGLIEVGRATALLFGADSNRRRYIRRVLIDDDRRRSTALLARLLAGAELELTRLRGSDGLAPEDRRWAPYQVLFLILGPLLLEPALESVLGSDPFSPATLADRSEANQRLLLRGILSPR